MNKREDSQLCAWSSLTRGDQVWLFRRGVMVGSGWVDAVMPDGSIIWLEQHDARGRAMFSRDEQTSVLRAG